VIDKTTRFIVIFFYTGYRTSPEPGGILHFCFVSTVESSVFSPGHVVVERGSL